MTANPLTQPQREALAAIVGITPETHRHLCYSLNGLYQGKIVELPCPFTGGDAADNVWMAPLMRWLVSVNRSHGVGPSFHKEPERAWAANFYHGCFPEYGATATAALMHSCREAGVPEIVAVFDMGESK